MNYTIGNQVSGFVRHKCPMVYPITVRFFTIVSGYFQKIPGLIISYAASL